MDRLREFWIVNMIKHDGFSRSDAEKIHDKYTPPPTSDCTHKVLSPFRSKDVHVAPEPLLRDWLRSDDLPELVKGRIKLRLLFRTVLSDLADGPPLPEPSPYTDVDIADAPVPLLHDWLKMIDLPDSQRDKINGELALRSIILKNKGKGAATGSCYGTGGSSKPASLPNPSFQTAKRHGSAPDHASIDITALESTPIIYQGGSVSGTASAEGSSPSDHTTHGATASAGGESLGPDIPQHSSPPRCGNKQVDQQDSHATAFSSEPTDPEQQLSACAPAGDGTDPGAYTACSEPPKFGKLPLAVLAAGAYGLLSRDRDTFQGPVEKVLLGCMILGFLSNFAWLLVRGNPRMARASVFLQWTAVWAIFGAFVLAMTLLYDQ